MFQRVLIANRGEIAVRVIRGLREMGIESVAVYSKADRGALHVRLADRAYEIGPAPSTESYLVGARLIATAKQARCQAIHPGYGFLSENAGFAESVEAAGLVFIGPPAHAIRSMGEKTRAREMAAAAGVPVVPGSAGAVGGEDEAARIAAGLGYPVLLKAVGGGGGKGMRLVREEAELRSALRLTRSEATAAFGAADVYLEKYVASPRHIEVQILADRHGNIIHLGERECSIQRRHQKVVEESPSPVMTEELRQRMGKAAIAVAGAAGYVNAGTVEFLYAGDGAFYFLEMNTRLQVEHPVTEAVVRMDLVKEQLRIAAGERLSRRQEDVHLDGAAIECRISAEDPEHGFLPATGRVTRFRPPDGPGVRMDAGIYRGYEVPLYYDPLLAKLIVWDTTRAGAIARTDRALREFLLEGVKTTLPFHRWLMQDPEFRAGRFTTEFIAQRFNPRMLQSAGRRQLEVMVAAAIAAFEAEKVPRARTAGENGGPPEGARPSGWKLAGRAWSGRRGSWR